MALPAPAGISDNNLICERGSPSYLLNSRMSQALAKSQSRMTVRSETFMTSTVSSTLSPPK